MRGKKARAIRKTVYPGDKTYRAREYRYEGNGRSRRSSGTLRVGERRTVYQTVKRMAGRPAAEVLAYLKRRHGLAIKVAEAAA